MDSFYDDWQRQEKHGRTKAPTHNGSEVFTTKMTCCYCSINGHHINQCQYLKRKRYRVAHNLCMYCGEPGHGHDNCRERWFSRRYRKENKLCLNCGDPHHFGQPCPRPLQVCSSCKRPGHTKLDCFSGKWMSRDKSPPGRQHSSDHLSASRVKTRLETGDLETFLAKVLPALALKENNWNEILNAPGSIATPIDEIDRDMDVEALQDYIKTTFISEPLPISTSSTALKQQIEQGTSKWRRRSHKLRALAIDALKSDLKRQIMDVGLQLATEEIKADDQSPPYMRGYIPRIQEYLAEKRTLISHGTNRGDVLGSDDDSKSRTLDSPVPDAFVSKPQTFGHEDTSESSTRRSGSSSATSEGSAIGGGPTEQTLNDVNRPSQGVWNENSNADDFHGVQRVPEVSRYEPTVENTGADDNVEGGQQDETSGDLIDLS